MEYLINSFPDFYMLFPSSANQSLANQIVQVVRHSEFSDATLGSSRMFSIIHRDYLKTLSLFQHGARTIHWFLAHRIDDVLKYQCHDCPNSPPPKSRTILSERAERNESKKMGLEQLQTLLSSDSVRHDLEVSLDSTRFSLGVQAASPNFLQTSPHDTLQILLPVLFGCLDVADVDVDLLSASLELISRPWNVPRIFSRLIAQSSHFISSFWHFFFIVRLSDIVFSG